MTEGQVTVVVYGAHYWGSGHDLATAKRNFRRQAGKLSLGYSVLEFDAETIFRGIDDMGRYTWTGNAPVERTVAPRGPKAAKR